MELQLFTTQAGRALDWEVFLRHPLGELYATIPFHLYESAIPYAVPKTGPKPKFGLQGGIGLQILKAYYGFSDAKLIEQLNHNRMMQLFCGIRLKVGEQIKDEGVVSRWRMRVGRFLQDEGVLRSIQLAHVSAWKEDLVDTKINIADATCYESYVRYPTDVKLLWECIEYLYKQMKIMSKYVCIPMLRSKYRDQKKNQLSYQKSRKKTYKKRQARKRSLLYLLNKYLDWLPYLIGLMKTRESERLNPCSIASNFFDRIRTINKVYQQQQLHFNNPKAKIKDRIVSLAKPYLRPIVRGKETKRVEFGMKVHEMQIGGINFIEHWDFNAFHEGVRLKKTIWLHRFLFKTKVLLFGGDQLYANNKNRKYCSGQGIQTCFSPKGKPSKDPTVRGQKRQLRQAIGKERSTRLEGSFGNKKNHYSLAKIKAKTLVSELAWVFFGNLTANAMAIVKKRKPPSL